MNGGTRARAGRPPDPNALRRDRKSDAVEFIHLPTEGRSGETPDWPLDRPSKRELEIWERLWKLPQAAAWEASHYVDTVGFYVRAYRIAEQDTARAADRTLVRQYQDTLGLTDAGMRANRWIIEPEAVASEARTNDANRRSARSRFKTIEGGAA